MEEEGEKIRKHETGKADGDKDSDRGCAFKVESRGCNETKMLTFLSIARSDIRFLCIYTYPTPPSPWNVREDRKEKKNSGSVFMTGIIHVLT